MKEIWIMGGGGFGSRAGKKLREKFPHRRIIGMERNVEKCKGLSGVFDEVVCGDGMKILYEHLKEDAAPEWIVPTVPLHVAFLWIKEKLSREGAITAVDLPDGFLAALPHAMRGQNRDIYVSIADFLCPADCPAPEKFCAKTKKGRPFHLYEEITHKTPEGFCPIVITSHQLAPGVGGIRPKSLFQALERIKDSRDPVVLATACRCHGVITGFAYARTARV